MRQGLWWSSNYGRLPFQPAEPLNSMHCNMLPVTGWNCLGIIDPRAPDCEGENVFPICQPEGRARQRQDLHVNAQAWPRQTSMHIALLEGDC